MEQLLTKQLPAADRPYSQDELEDIRQRNLDRLNIGSTMVYHPNSGYFYLAKSGGKKEAAVLSGEVLEDGCCSVCWKLRKTPSELREIANTMIDEFILRFEKKPEKWTRELIHLENIFYKWLYIDFDRKKGERRFRNNRDDNGGERRFRNNRDDNGGERRFRNNHDDNGGERRFRNNRRDNGGDRRPRNNRRDNGGDRRPRNNHRDDDTVEAPVDNTPPELTNDNEFPAL
jgi:hypothetical protein